MTDSLLALLPAWGALLLAVVTFLSCLALPIPASVVMLTAGALAAGGDLPLAPAAAAAVAGAVAGDQIGFWAGRRWGGPLMARTSRNPSRAALVTRARSLIDRRGETGVFLSRWLFSPLGPWINLAAGAAAMPWRHFTPPAILGEILWVGLYLGLGFAFAGSVARIADIGGALSGLLAALAVTLGAGAGLRFVLRQRRPVAPAS
jgi:membrane protein DedA with SNARE-associated domain